MLNKRKFRVGMLLIIAQFQIVRPTTLTTHHAPNRMQAVWESVRFLVGDLLYAMSAGKTASA